MTLLKYIFSLSQSVEEVGPSVGISTFFVEHANGHLFKYVTAVEGMPLQITEHCIIRSLV